MIRLKTFLISLCAVIIAVTCGFFYFEANRVLGKSFQEIDSIHSKSVAEYTRTALEGRKYLLTAYREQIDPEYRLAKAFLVGRGKKDFAQVKGMLNSIRRRTKCDIVDILDSTDGSAVISPELRKVLGIEASTRAGVPKVLIADIKGQLVLVSVSPLMLFRYPVGTIILGFNLNQELAQQVSGATNAEVSFGPTGRAGAIPIRILDVNGDLALSVKSPVMTGITGDLRREVLLIAGASLILVTLLIYSVLNFGFLRSFRAILQSIESGAGGLERDTIIEWEPKRFPIREVTTLSSAFSRFTKSLKDYQRRIRLKSQTEAAGKVVSLLAHDINKIAGALYMELNIGKAEISEQKRRALYGFATRIKGITGSVIGKFRKNQMETEEGASADDFFLPTEPPTVEMLSLLVDSVVVEKTSLYWDRANVGIEVEIDPETFGIFVEVQSEYFRRILGTLVDNAVQSISGAGKVSLSVWADDKSAYVRVIDTGCGIPSDKVPSLGEWGNSFGKPDGVGVGFWHVKQLVDFWKGGLKVDSVPGSGTSIVVRLPRSRKDSILLPNLALSDSAVVVILDDEDSMHDQWKSVFGRAGVSRPIEFIHFKRAEDCLVWWRMKGRYLGGPLTFLCDYELQGSDWNGLQVIEEMGASESSILVTGYFDSVEVRQECARLGVRLIPKPLVPFLPMVVKHVREKAGAEAKGGAA